MTPETQIGIFGNGPAIESTRNLLGSLLTLLIVDNKVYGRENLEGLITNPAILCFFPHCGHLDTLLIRYASPVDVRRMLVVPAAGDHWYKNRVMEIISSLALITVPIERRNHGGMKQSLDHLQGILCRGFSLLISPEGTRSSLPLSERQFKNGPVELALLGGRPIIPVRVKGLEKIWPKGKPLKLLENGRPWDTSVTFGRPITVPKTDVPYEKHHLRGIITSKIKETLLDM